mmetsp:Transcript_41375/g.72741  ORF Transcript_41375/g.72741 Transcript_41375/m.72741 type:complete len:424 (-) Transcript_41375:111-1382(-)
MMPHLRQRCYVLCGAYFLVLFHANRSSSNNWIRQLHAGEEKTLVKREIGNYTTNNLSLVPKTTAEREGADTSNQTPDVLAALLDGHDKKITQPLSVTLTFQKHRRDRMGSRIQLPLSAWLVARHHGWNFCSPPDPMASVLKFTICSSGYETLKLLQGPRFEYHDDNITDSGVYYINRVRNTLWATIANSEQNAVSMLDNGAVEDWRQMIVSAYVRPELEEELWLSQNSVRVAVHARRGDIRPGERNDVWIGDNQIIALIEMAKYYIRLKRGQDVTIEVHMFSEAYGVTNWTQYDTLVDRFHLAPEGSTDIERNLRDWKHFVLADVLIIGGSFSSHPAIARPDPSPDDGFPMTLSKKRGGVGVVRKWIRWYWDRGRGLIVANFPDGTLTATIGGGSEVVQSANSNSSCDGSNYVMDLCFVTTDV